MTEVLVWRGGKSDWRILRAGPKSPTLEWAMEECRKYLNQIGGCDLSTTDAPRGRDIGAPALVLGLRADLDPADAALLPPAAAGHDGYAVCVTAKAPNGSPRIVVGGDNGRGVVYGVYDLLERIGCRWFYPTLDDKDPEVVPKRDTIRVAEGKWAKASPIRYRLFNASGMIYTVKPEMAKKQTDAAMKQRYNGMAWQCETKTDLRTQYDEFVSSGVMAEIKKRGMFFQGPLHSFHYFLKTEDYFEEHPEWFGMRNGKRVPHSVLGAQFCWSSTEARKVFVDNVAAFVRSCPKIDILCMCALDGGKACECSECATLNPSDNLLMVFNEMAERLAKVAPHVAVETYGGYPPVEEPPKRVRLHPRLRLLWAHWGRYHGKGYDDPTYDYKWNLDVWREVSKGRGLTLCQYYTDHFAEPWIAAPYAVAVIGDRKYALGHDVDGIYMLEHPEGYWWNCGLNAYLGGVCFYDASADPYEIIRDYALSYFGKDAGPLMAAYYEEWARNVDLCYHVRGGADGADRALLAEERKKYIDPAMTAAREDPILAYRVGKVNKLHALAERLMEIQRLDRETERLRRAGDFARARQRLDEGRTRVEETAAHIQRLVDLNEGLVDEQLLTFYFPRVRAWIEQETEALKVQSRDERGNAKKRPDVADMIPDEARG